MLWRNLEVIFSLLLMIAAVVVPDLPPLTIMPLCGLALLTKGWRYAKWKPDDLKNGQSTRGVILSAGLDRNTSMLGKHPVVLTYRYESHDSKPHEGQATTWDHSTRDRSQGNEIWVIHTPDKTAVSSICPPIH